MEFTRMNLDGEYRQLICRCGDIMSDAEPHSKHGEFWHETYWLKSKKGKLLRKPKRIDCPNAGKVFSLRDLADNKRLELFVRKRVRRAAKKLGARVVG